MDASQIGTVDVLENIFNSVFRPALKMVTEWGSLTKTTEGRQTHRKFIDNCKNFVDCLHSKNMHPHAIIIRNNADFISRPHQHYLPFLCNISITKNI